MSQKKTDLFRIYKPQQLANGRSGHNPGAGGLLSLHKTDTDGYPGDMQEGDCEIVTVAARPELLC